jgi:hypothetical protein
VSYELKTELTSSRLLIKQATFDCRVSKELTTLRRPGRAVEGNLSFFLLSVVFSTSRLDHPSCPLSSRIEGRDARDKRILLAP